jgi:hypothetical protein
MSTEDQLMSSTYHVLTPLGNVSHSNINNQMTNRIMSILNDRLDDAQQHKDSFVQNSMQPILFDVLIDLKQRNGKKKLRIKINLFLCIGLSMRQLSDDNDSYKKELARLDTMLIAERIIERYPNELLNNNNNNSMEIEHPEYQANLTRIRQFYHSELATFDKNSNDFCTHVVTLLHQQSQTRPISSEEITHMVAMVRKKLCIIQIQLKQKTCEAVMSLRTRFLDARYLEKQVFFKKIPFLVF